MPSVAVTSFSSFLCIDFFRFYVNGIVSTLIPDKYSFQFIKHRVINQINTLSSKASIINLPGVLPNLPLIPVQDQVVEEILPGGVVAAFEPEHQLIDSEGTLVKLLNA